MTARETGDGIEAVLAKHEPKCPHRGCPSVAGPIYCHPCSEAIGDWVEWTPAHVAAALRASAPEDDLRADLANLANHWDRLATGNEAARGRNTKVAAYYRKHAAQVRALLADQPPTPDEGVSP